MSTKRRKKVSLKQYVVKLTEAVIDHCCKQFGYSKKPILKERQMPNSFYAFQAKDSKRRRYVIYYNYRMFLGFCKGDSSIEERGCGKHRKRSLNHVYETMQRSYRKIL